MSTLLDHDRMAATITGATSGTFCADVVAVILWLQFPGGSERCVEDLKARYYAVARQLLTGRDGGAQGVGNQAIIKHPYNAAHERFVHMYHVPSQCSARSPCPFAVAYTGVVPKGTWAW